MSFQIIFREAESISVLGDVASSSDIFLLPDATLGVAIPTEVFEAAGEEKIMKAISQREYFYLWAGEWKRPIPEGSVERSRHRTLDEQARHE